VRPEDRVLLKVGGKHFETTRRTMTAALDMAPDSLLGVMFSGRHEGMLQPDGEGRVRIERSGPLFEYILDFLRAYSTGDEDAAFAIHALPEIQMADGQVVVVGGYDGTAVFSTTEVLNLTSNTWSPGPNMTSGRVGCAAVPLSSHQILVIGGNLSTTEIIDLVSETSTPGPEMSCMRKYCSAVMLHDGRVLIIGGRNRTQDSLSTTEVLNLTSGTSSPGPQMGTARQGTSATLLPEDGGVLVIGGFGTDKTYLATTEVLDVAANTTSAGPKLGIPRSVCAAVKMPGECILVIGGSSGGKRVSTSEILCMPTEERQQQKRRRLT